MEEFYKGAVGGDYTISGWRSLMNRLDGATYCGEGQRKGNREGVRVRITLQTYHVEPDSVTLLFEQVNGPDNFAPPYREARVLLVGSEKGRRSLKQRLVEMDVAEPKDTRVHFPSFH